MRASLRSSAGGASTAALRGNAMVTSVAGVLTFTDLRVDTVGNYSLLFEVITGASDFAENSDSSSGGDSDPGLNPTPYAIS